MSTLVVTVALTQHKLPPRKTKQYLSLHKNFIVNNVMKGR